MTRLDLTINATLIYISDDVLVQFLSKISYLYLYKYKNNWIKTAKPWGAAPNNWEETANN